MAEMQYFRTAFRGFNREDVVHYIEYMNQQHRKQLEQLSAQVSTPDPAILARLEAAEARCAQLEAELEALHNAKPVVVNPTGEELEAYRRAERAERQAQERAQQIYTQANAVLADVTLKTETASVQVADAADQIVAKLQSTKTALQDAVTTLYAIRPEK